MGRRPSIFGGGVCASDPKFGWKEGNARTGLLDSRPERIRQVAEKSLKLMKTDYIDLFYQHRVDPDVPIEEVAKLVASITAFTTSAAFPALTSL